MYRSVAFAMFMLAAPAVVFFTRNAPAQSLYEETFQVAAESEAQLDLTAAAPGTSWQENGKEAAVATIFLDGRYHQDLILVGGARSLTYPLMLGRLSPGTHSFRVEQNRRQSAAKAPTISIKAAKVTCIDRSQAEFQALSLAPIIYARRNTIGRFSDAPLLAWYEVERSPSGTSLRYSIIFSNEDGGTQTNALMARWGRTTDIELIYEAQLDAQGRLMASVYQGKNHKNLQFHGNREADHPLFIVATDNNMFSDEGQSEMRFALRPMLFDLSHASREELMYQHPWTYRVMAEELLREHKINDSSRVGQQIADPRRYLYLEAGATQESTAVSFAVKLTGDPRWYTSDIGINYYKVDRSGYFQTTVRLPVGATIGRIERLAVRCDVAGDPREWEEISKVANANCEITDIKRVFMLDEQYQPGPSLPLRIQPLQLQFGDMIELYSDHLQR